ncbi:MAG: 30S ribosomal protein S18 [Phycisphaerae bacterium]|nr:30S ribosomal protein S18 [Phycisphaerae bacterium]
MRGRGKTTRRKKKPRIHEIAKCRFCREKVSEVDYKDVDVLNKLTTQQGKMFSRKRSGNCAPHQRSCMKAIKRARFLGLLPYVG